MTQATTKTAPPDVNDETAQTYAAWHLAEAMRIFNDAIRKADQAGLTVEAKIITMRRQKKTVPLISVSARALDGDEA